MPTAEPRIGSAEYVDSTPSTAGVDHFSVRDNLRAADRWDPQWLFVRATQLVRNTPIQKVTLAPGGGTLDIHFVVEDRRAAYKAAAPIIRELVTEFSLLMDFHFVSPDDIED